MMHKAKACRLGQPCSPRTFKQMLACRTQHHPTLDAETIADRAELRRDRLYSFSNENDATSQIPLPALLRICHAIDEWDLLDFALLTYGRRTTPIETTSSRGVTDAAMGTTVAVGRLVESVQIALLDGRVDDAERQDIHARVRIARRQLDDVDGALDGAVDARRRA